VAWIQPALPGGQYAPPIPYPDGVPPPPGAVIVATGPIPPPPPGFPGLPGYQPGGLAGMLPAPPPLPGFWPMPPALPAVDVAGLAGAGAAAAMLGPFSSATGGVPLWVLVIGILLAGFFLFIFLNPFIKALVAGTGSASSLTLFLPLILIGGLVLLLAVGGGGGGQSWVLFGALAILVLLFIPLFGLFPSLSLTP